MNPMIATDLNSVPADTFKYVILMLIGLLGVGATIIGIFTALRRKSVSIEPQPMEVRKQPKRYNHDLTEQRFTDHERRLVALEGWRETLVNKLDEDKVEILHAGETRAAKLHSRINNANRMLFLVCGKLGINVTRDSEETET